MSKVWPELEYDQWLVTYQTLHRWVQIVGKVRLSNEPWVNHSWSSTLYVTSRGLGTGAIPDNNSNFSIDFDFVDHHLKFQSSNGRQRFLPLKNESISSFYERVISVLEEWGVNPAFSPRPNELQDDTPFLGDTRLRIYNPWQAHSCWQAMVSSNNILKEFRARFEGKCSPVHFFWGSFDLAVTRFSGRSAPDHPGGVPHLPLRVAREAYSHEVSSCGFWPGNEQFPHAAFYSYAYPEPPGFLDWKVEPADAFYHPELKEFLLPYAAVKNSSSPRDTLLQFFESTFEAAATLGNWDRSLFEMSPSLRECRSRREKAGEKTEGKVFKI